MVFIPEFAINENSKGLIAAESSNRFVLPIAVQQCRNLARYIQILEILEYAVKKPPFHTTLGTFRVVSEMVLHGCRVFTSLVLWPTKAANKQINKQIS